MATLYQSTSRVRKGLVGFFIVSIIIILWGFISGLFNSERLFVDPEAGRYYAIADAGLGPIPAVEIPGITFNSEARFEQQSAHTAILPDVGIVYKIDKPRQKLLSVDRAEVVVERLGFELSNRQEGNDPNELIWTKEEGTRTILYNKVDQLFDLNTNYRQNTQALSRKTMLSLDTYIQQALTSTRSLNLDSFGFNTPTISATFTTLGVDGIFRDTTEQSNADFVFIDVQRDIPLANLKTVGLPEIPAGLEDIIVDRTGVVYSDDPRFGQIHYVTSGEFSDLARDTFELEFIDFEYNLNETGVYPIITPDEAWVNIQRGQGSLVFIQPQGENYYGSFDSIEVREFTADFRETELGYWEPNEWTGFVTPIYIFRGTATLNDGRLAEFIFYVDALKRV